MQLKFDKKELRSNLLYIITGILLIVLVVLIVLAVRGKNGSDSGSGKSKKVTVQEDDMKLQENVFPEVSALVTQYYNASAVCDYSVLEQLESAISESDRQIIQRKSEYIESYNEIVTHTVKCPKEGSYLVFTSYKIKFVNKQTLVPGLETLYIETSQDGRMSIFDGDVDKATADFIGKVVNGKEVTDLINSVNESYVQVLANDADILAFIEKFEGSSELIEKAKKKAEEARNAQAQQAAAQAQKDAEAAAAAQAQQQADAAAQAQQAAANAQTTNETVAITSTVNIRQSNDENSAKIGSVTVGENVTRTSITENGWSKIQYSGLEGFVKSEFVSAFHLTGDTVKATTTVNVRSECSETANISGQLVAGTAYKRNASYDSGWSQIVVNGAVGYVKSEFLTN